MVLWIPAAASLENITTKDNSEWVKWGAFTLLTVSFTPSPFPWCSNYIFHFTCSINSKHHIASFFCFLRRTQFHHPLICTHCKSALLGTSRGACSVSYSHLQLFFFSPPASTPPRQPSYLHFCLEATSLLCLIQTSKHFLFCMCVFLSSSTFKYPVLELVSCTKVTGPLMSYKYMSGTRPNGKKKNPYYHYYYYQQATFERTCTHLIIHYARNDTSSVTLVRSFGIVDSLKSCPPRNIWHHGISTYANVLSVRFLNATLSTFCKHVNSIVWTIPTTTPPKMFFYSYLLV